MERKFQRDEWWCPLQTYLMPFMNLTGQLDILVRKGRMLMHPQALVKIFVESCFHCHQKQPSIKPLKGAKKPIVSSEFCDQFQVDLIDMRNKMKKNMYHVIQRWITTLKDHATSLIYVTSIPRKKANMLPMSLTISLD